MTESPRHRSGPDATPSPASDHTSLPRRLAITNLDPAMNPVPALGEHTEDILRGLGRTDTAIAVLRANGVI
jgi:itaconate CoA-transferase